ncbi:MAG: DNA mismatch repair protein MutS [Rikenellaceae bacterium]|nr:DNA mismatch repair protein MutS [Rikenellaceae bacterium]
MKQYYDIKAQHPDAVLLFRVGDFYETFGDDAIRASRILGITLTRRANGAASYVELAGFPYHALDTYLPKLVRAGERAAICEQLEDPKLTKKIVKRGVTELVTPGVSFNDNVHNHKENTFLCSVCFAPQITGVAFLDVTTGEFLTAEGDDIYVDKLISNLAPKEIVYQRGHEGQFKAAFGVNHYTYRLEEWMFSPTRTREKLLAQLGVTSLKGYGIDTLDAAVTAAGAILYYLDFTEHRQTKHITSISRIDEDRYVWIDKFSIRNLELLAPNHPEGTSFVDVLDRTVSPMGARMLRRWVSLPLKDVVRINRRLDVVTALAKAEDEREKIGYQLTLVGDLERIVSKVAVMRVTPREVVQLKNALYAIEQVREVVASIDNPTLREWAGVIDLCLGVRSKIEREIFPDPSNQIQKGGVIADGVDLELDELRRIATRGKDILAEIQESESRRTGITSLKISFNNVFGYYIEVRNTHKDKVPPEWIRKQTLVGAERYITAELKEYEEKILGAQEKILAVEQRLFAALLEELTVQVAAIQRDAAILARLDCLLSFARVSLERAYTRPTVNDCNVLDIKDGRHPVIETVLPIGEVYVPNDVYLDDKTQQIMMITGPNMSGKSALLRQTALIVLMAQIGCYVPALAAEIGIVDKIFTRVGASDNISQGESTFMVEMLESASILNNVSDRSLILLDEIGRGTSTYDGISIAWAMVEYIHNHPRAKAKTLFATHYHELNEMEELFERVKNYNVSVKEVENSVVFLRKLTRGGTEHSFGIHVARMAGMPPSIVARAGQILADLERAHRGAEPETTQADRDRRKAAGELTGHRGATLEAKPSKGTKAAPAATGASPAMQLSIFQLEDPVLKQIRDEIRDLDINSLTPLEALNKLSDIKKITGL